MKLKIINNELRCYFSVPLHKNVQYVAYKYISSSNKDIWYITTTEAIEANEWYNIALIKHGQVVCGAEDLETSDPIGIDIGNHFLKTMPKYLKNNR